MAEELIKQIQRDRLSYNYAHAAFHQEIKELNQPYWETKLLVNELRCLYDDPQRPLSEKQRESLDILFMDQERDGLGRQALGLTKQEQEEQRQAQEKTPRLIATIDDALQAKHDEVAQMVYSLRGADEPKDMLSIMQRRQEELFELQAGLAQQHLKYAGYVNEFTEVSLELMSTLREIMLEINLKADMDRHRAFDDYYCALADSLALRIKILRVTILSSTYDERLVEAMRSLRSILEARYADARKQLMVAEKQIQRYESMGKEFDTIAQAYFGLLDDIRATQDDIERINASK
ncbi:HAUS augmin-like complex subunit 4-domain-containing protein [Syncephalastrum racemosum]|uniref:HAUS augmin-like complex subunit 4-domain-containing protein n=1 Tax=Syncephalastrum racemosum TaxID=13706 RepID=A0A1X2HQU1_SYNRA|nr:HAUS augmin-like complex subunit 4-domain-containing protein [Syncephalastrum racemosum]